MPEETPGAWAAPSAARPAPPPDGKPEPEATDPDPPADADGERPVIREYGTPRPTRAGAAPAASSRTPSDVFRNTYYDFPREGSGAKEATLFDASCTPIASVPKAFHDQVCVQGSGRLASGATVSFAKRDCSCAATCPRTGQQVCFERLDPARFPSGRGAMGSPITPLRTVAVDSDVIPLGTVLFIPELAGLPRPDGTRHDGCFVAEDRGVKVVGNQIDVFTGDPSVTARWNALYPSNRGVHVRLNEARCSRGPTAPH